MAMTRRIGEGWTLTDGVLDPFLISRPMEVHQALAAQGLIARQAGGSALTAQEWTRLRTFTYACRFDMPQEDDELASLHFPMLAGTGWIRLNGHICWRFEGRGVHFPIPGNAHVKQTGNLLEIVCEPDPMGRPRGPVGDVFLRTANYLYLHDARFDGRGEQISVKLHLSAFTSGKYVFKYTVALDGNMAVNAEFIERLRVMDDNVPIEHVLSVPDPVLWDPARPDDTAYTVKLSVERLGVGCEQCVAQVAMLPEGFVPTRIVKLQQALLAPGDLRERTLTAARELGAEAVLIEDDRVAEADRAQIYVNWSETPEPPSPALTQENLLPYGMLALDRADCEALPVPMALASLDTLRLLGGDWGFWPTDRPLYRWFGAPPIDVEGYEARFGVNAAGDAGRCIRLSRMLQAENLYRAACEARLAGRAMLLDQPMELSPAPESRALIEVDGTQRPACQAIEDAWAAQCAYVRLPEAMAAACCAALELPIFLMTDRNGRQLSVTASVFGQDERRKLAQQTFEGAKIGELGRLKLTMPSETQALTVRCEIQSGGSLLWRHDSVLCAHKESDAPMAAMMKL